MATKMIRVTLTFELDPTKTSEAAIKERLDALLVANFKDCEDWNARWVAELSDAPLYGAAKKGGA